ncbi:MAG: Cell division protein sepF [Firmicutes bacterium]|nr:Cell division protein sepF [Bacillota bacterium]
MKFIEKVWGGLGLFEAEDAVGEESTLRQDEYEPKTKKGNLVNLNALPKQMRVMVVDPSTFDDAQHVAEHLKSRKPVVVNLENADNEIAKRIVDFVSGTTYALNGSIQKIGNNIFLCAPNNVDVAYSSREESDKSFLPWNSKR